MSKEKLTISKEKFKKLLLNTEYIYRKIPNPLFNSKTDAFFNTQLWKDIPKNMFNNPKEMDTYIKQYKKGIAETAL